MPQYYEESKLTYQQIVMGQIKKIQDISAKELRDGEKTIKNLIGEQLIEGEDTRFSYLQSVEMLGSLLSPYFSPEVKKDFEDFCNLYDMELTTAMEDKEFLEELKDIFNKEIKKIDLKEDYIKTQTNIYFLNFKIITARRMFRTLIKLFKDNSFLNSEAYGEGSGNSSDEGLDAIDEEIEETEKE